MKKDENKNVTIYDIARVAQTSPATVSRVLNEDSDYPVSDKLKKKVLQTAENLNYTPNILGKQLKTKKINEIGVIIPNISNPFYPQLIAGVEKVLREKGYNVLLYNSYRKPSNEKECLKSLLEKQIRGIIVSSITKNHDYLNKLQKNNVKIVAFEQNLDFDCNKITFNYYKGGRLAAKHLIELGHRDIGFISAPLIRYSRKMVYKGFVDYLTENKIKINKKYIEISQEEEESFEEIYEFKNGKRLAEKFIKKGKLPTAILCINDMTACGVIQKFHENNINIPEDVSIMGFDNIPLSQIISPSLSTIDQSTYEMGSTAATVLINNIEDERQRNLSISLNPSLVVRRSTGEKK